LSNKILTRSHAVIKSQKRLTRLRWPGLGISCVGTRLSADWQRCTFLPI